ncbi:MAG: asparagine synthase-related protein [Yaniella sp.]
MSQSANNPLSGPRLDKSVTTPFARGFLLNTLNGYAPKGFAPGPLLPGLSVEPSAGIEWVGSFYEKFIIIIGTCVETGVPTSAGTRVAGHLLRALEESEAKFYEVLSNYAGRYALIYGDQNTIKVVNDATAMRPIYYAHVGGVVASHALLVEQAMSGSIRKSDMPFRYGYPGNATPYRRTKILTPNTYYNLATNRVGRFWPRQNVAERSVNEAAHEILDRAVQAIQNIAAQRPIKMALTAGLDSRTMLAIMMHSGVEFETYTYGIGADTLMDRNLATDLAHHLGVKHTVIKNVQTPSGLRNRLDDAHYATHHKSTVASLAAWFDDTSTAAVTANLLEIGRTFYQHAKKVGVEAPITASALKNLHYRSIPKSGKQAIADWGKELYDFVANECFADFLDETGFADAAQFVDAFDLFYWEHRMSAWHGAAMVERDYYAEPFIPFNARAILEIMLGVPEENRQSADVFYKIINTVNPGLTDLPINPKSWPRENKPY